MGLRNVLALPRHNTVRYAEDLGARVYDHVDAGTTHVVVKRGETEKCKQGANVVGCRVVSVNWLMECFWGVKRRNEEDFLLAPVKEGVREEIGGGGGKRKREGRPAN